jgi:hypothetical protein
LRGGVAAGEVDASPERPTLFVERSTRIAKLAIDPDLTIRLADEKGARVDRSVVHVDVLDPSGKPVRAYSSNVTIAGGFAAFHIPFALNDPKGRWTVKARDVISGLTAVARLSARTGL